MKITRVEIIPYSLLSFVVFVTLSHIHANAKLEGCEREAVADPAREGNGGVVIDAERAERVFLKDIVLRSRGLTWDAQRASAVAIGSVTNLVRLERCEVRGFTAGGRPL